VEEDEYGVEGSQILEESKELPMGLPRLHMPIHLIHGEVVCGVEVPDTFSPVVCSGHTVRLTLQSPVDTLLRLHF